VPRLVDHEVRRAEIIDATWRLIADRGIDATTLREIAREMGMANGALTHYFPDKNAIIQAAFEYVFQATNDRIAARLGNAVGLEALRVFCREVMPVEAVTLLEARVVIPFWQRALTDTRMEAVFVDSMAQWRRDVEGYLARARADGDVRTPAPDHVLAEQLLAMITGLQILATLTPGTTTAALQTTLLDTFLAGLT
jgi:AcrR family transcriptional regulator